MDQSLKTPCLVCGNNRWSEFIDTGLLECGNCGFVTADVVIGEQEMLSLYEGQYFCGGEYFDYQKDKEFMQKNFEQRLRKVREFVPNGFLVEVGCAYGFFLELAKNYFQVVGYDVSAEAVDYANTILGVPARREDFLSDGSLSPGSVDVIVMWDVIEHLPQPARFIKRSAELLRPGGYLFVTTGDIKSWLPRFQGARWRLIHPPTHLHYFSQNNLKQLLSLEGLEVVQVRYPGYRRSVEQILHGLFVVDKGREPTFLYGLLRRTLPKRMGVYMNTFDIMCVVANRV